MPSDESAGVIKVLAPPKVSSPLVIGEAAAVLAERLQNDDLLFAASDEVRGLAIARALAGMAPGAEIIFCPSSDALPGDDAPASPANVGQRSAALRRLRLAQTSGPRPRIALITTGEALGRAYPEPSAYAAAPPRVAIGDPADLPALFEQLREAGYIHDERVDEPGEVALRGQVLDVFPADAGQPLRLEAAAGRIVSVRGYDPATQRTTEELEAQELGRVAEPDIADKGTPLTAHLAGAVLAIEPAAEDRRKRYLLLAADAGTRRPSRAVKTVIDDASWQKAIQSREQLQFPEASTPAPRFVEEKAPLRAFAKAAREAIETGQKIAILGAARDLRFLLQRIGRLLGQNFTQIESWADILAAKPGSLLALEAPMDHGFATQDIYAVAAADLLGSRAQRVETGIQIGEADIFALGEIRIGDVVVHEDHGIAIVDGVQPMPATGESEPGEAIALRHAGDGMRLVPVGEAGRLWRYGSDPEAVTPDKLDGSSWEKRRAAIELAIAETAKGMIALAEERAKKKAPKLEPEPAAYERFAANFPFSETRDQARAIEAVRADLASGTPMDRLVIGDVGFGKTEVALRAAALAALAGHQVALAAPTTVLARQHLESFTQRFEGTAIEVAGLSRLSSAAEKKRVRAGLADGSIQIVIGTGAVASHTLSYNKLALVIIDEEQRFGAADKARLHQLGADHVLTLSATPIPRTLQSALVGLQQLSVIATPPARRRPIRTEVGAFDKDRVRAALLRERSRGGQSFIVVPRIEEMAPIEQLITSLVPEFELLQAHGKMPAAEIDDTMVRFGCGQADVLLATNIIEAGLDVPRANTMVIWRADRFGLSQLHQLRGRVGRGSRRGQVLLLTEPDKKIAPRTLKRLRTLEAFDRLGAGFAISAQDLDMRGAGDLLGEAQAGHMKLIGVDLYQHLLEGALRSACGETADRWTPELHLGLEGRLPEGWIPDAELRLNLYIRLARADAPREIEALEAELEDRFGALPEEANSLLTLTQIRVSARQLEIARIDAGPAAIALTPRKGFSAELRQSGLSRNGDRLILAERIEDRAKRLARVEALLEALHDKA